MYVTAVAVGQRQRLYSGGVTVIILYVTAVAVGQRQRLYFGIRVFTGPKVGIVKKESKCHWYYTVYVYIILYIYIHIHTHNIICDMWLFQPTLEC
jgi:hypothetical protein